MWLYLASQSPRCAQLLEQIGVRYALLLPHADEDAESLETVLPQEQPADYVQRVTGLKLEAALQRWAQRGIEQAPILCADTTVALGDRILGKPSSAEEAFAMLRSLSDTQHTVYTAIAVGDPSTGQQLHALSASQVWFDDLSDARIHAYIATQEPFGKAGAYGVQGHAATLIARIEGSFSGIMGLPLFETATLLRQLGWTL